MTTTIIIDSLIDDDFADAMKYDRAIKTLMWILAIPNILGTVLLTFSMNSPGTPPTPASPTSAKKSLPFFTGLKIALKNVNYLMILAFMSTSTGLVGVIQLQMPNILCPFGFSKNFSQSYAVAILISSGVIGSVIISKIADKTGKIELIAKICIVPATFGIIGFVLFGTGILDNVSISQNLVIASLSIFGFFGYPLMPLSYELSVETTYPVGPATSAGLCWIISSLGTGQF